MSDNYKGQNPPETVVIINQVLIGYVGIPDSVKGAIESKLRADQEQQAMDFTIMREKKEAERKKVEAEGIQAFQTIVSKGIDDRLLRWKGIEATLKLAESHNAKVIVIGGGSDGLPILLNGTGDASIQVPPKK
jgi:regulator of protease activity HflC (stomatin/prohibitin superfamily)